MRICPTLGITRAAFLRLDKKERNEIKQVPFFVPACFKDSPSRRVYECATVCNLIFLDVDPETERGPGGKQVETGHYPAAPFVNNPNALYRALDGFNFAAHVTASSTPEKPRMRIAIDAQDIPLKLYARAVQTVGMMLGLTVTTESKVAVQPMFLPTLFSDSPEDEDALLAYELEGRPFTVADISDSATSLEYSESKPRDIGPDNLAFLRAQVPEITLGIAKEALDAIDPDCDFHEWTHVAMALRHQFSPRLDDEAFELFDDWSKGGSKYPGERQIEKKWGFVHNTSVGRVPITIRSLLRSAVAAGWDDKKVKESCFNSLVRWMEESASGAIELAEQGAQKILAAPLMSPIQKDVLIDMLCKNAHKRFAYKLNKRTIEKQLKALEKEIKAQEKVPEKKKEPRWLNNVLYNTSAHEFYNRFTGEKYKTDPFNNKFSKLLLPSEEDLKEAGIVPTLANLSRPIVLPSAYALNTAQISTAYDYAYDPSTLEVWFIEKGKRYINTYSPTYPELDTENKDIAGALFQRHLRHLIAEPEYRKTITDYMAFMVQRPGVKIRWAMLIQSVEGAGKTFLAEVMKAVLGVEHVKTISDGAIKSGYNEWSFGAQLVILEEVRVQGTNRFEIMNALKPLITNDDISINEKFRSQRTAKNISNYIAFSNFGDALALTPGDRRWFVIKSPLQHKAQVLALGENYFPPLYKMLREMPGALRAYLMDWQISEDFRPDGHAPRTKYVQELVNDTAGDLTAAVRRLVVEGDYPLIQFDIVSAKTLMDVVQGEEGLIRATSQQLAQVLREEGYQQIGRHMIGSERHYIWVRSGADQNTAVGKAAHRVKHNLKNLCMDLIYAR